MISLSKIVNRTFDKVFVDNKRLKYLMEAPGIGTLLTFFCFCYIRTGSVSSCREIAFAQERIIKSQFSEFK